MNVCRYFKRKVFFILMGKFVATLGLRSKRSSKFPDVIAFRSLVPLFRWRVFILLNWLIFLLFTNLLTELLLIPTFLAISRGFLWVPGKSTCELISFSANSAFSSVITVIGRPEPVLLFMDPSSLNRFKRRWRELSTHSFDLYSLHTR